MLYFLSFYYIVYKLEHCLSYQLSIWWHWLTELAFEVHTKGLLFHAWVPLISIISIYFHHQCVLFLSRIVREEFSFSIWLDFLSCLFWAFINFLSFSSAIAVMIRFSLLPRAYDAKFSLSSLTQSSMLISPLPPLLLGRYNRLPFYLECNPPYMVIIFLVFQSTFFSSSFVYSIMPGLYQTVGTSHVFITWNTCFAFNFYFNIALNLLYLFLS